MKILNNYPNFGPRVFTRRNGAGSPKAVPFHGLVLNTKQLANKPKGLCFQPCRPKLKPSHLKKNCTFVCFSPVQDQNDGMKKGIKALSPKREI